MDETARDWEEVRLAAVRAVIEAADDFGHDNLVMGDAEKLAGAVLAVCDEEAVSRMAAQFADETRIRGMDFRAGMHMELEPSKTLVAHWVAAARTMIGDAVNYVEMEIGLAGEERYVLILQRAEKLTPHQARKQAEAERDQARAELEASRASTRLPGHGLRAEGKPYVRDLDGRWIRAENDIGRGVCSCGAFSDVHASDAARKRWHREHKAEMRSKEKSGG